MQNGGDAAERGGADDRGAGAVTPPDRRPIRASIRTPTTDSPDLFGDDLRDAFARWASGVAVIAASDGDEIDSITVTAFTSLSVDPPLVLLALGTNASILTMIRETGRFTVSLLTAEQRAIASAVADRVPGIERDLAIEGGRPGVTGRLAGFDCLLEAEYPGGDHHIIVGRVEATDIGAGDPLLHFNRGYRTLGGPGGRT